MLPRVHRHARSIDIGRFTVGGTLSTGLVPPNTFLTLSWVRDSGRIIGLSGSVAHRGWYAFVLPKPAGLGDQLKTEGDHGVLG